MNYKHGKIGTNPAANIKGIGNTNGSTVHFKMNRMKWAISPWKGQYQGNSMCHLYWYFFHYNVCRAFFNSITKCTLIQRFSREWHFIPSAIEANFIIYILKKYVRVKVDFAVFLILTLNSCILYPSYFLYDMELSLCNNWLPAMNKK